MVEPGDTLYKISRFFATQPDVLVRKNNFTNPEKLSIGQFIDIFVPYIPTNMIFEKSNNGYTLKSERFLLIKDLKFLLKTVNGNEIEYEVGVRNDDYFGKIDIEPSTHGVFKLSVLLNLSNPTVEKFNIRFKIPNMSFYMATAEIFRSNSKSVKFIISEKTDFRTSDIKRLKIKIPNGSLNLVFYGGIVNLKCENDVLEIDIELKTIENVSIYRTQMALFFQKN